MKTTFRIAEMNMLIESSDRFSMLSIPGFNEFLTENVNDPDLAISLNGDTSARGLMLESHSSVIYDFEKDGVHTVISEADQDGTFSYLLTMESSKGKVYMLCNDSRFECNWESVADMTMFKFMLWIPFAMAGASRMTVPIHSSTAVSDGKAFLFLGESGTGKSTHSRLWLGNVTGAYLLNDDSPIVVIDQDGAWAYGSPWSGKSHCYRNERQPLGAFVRLSQATYNKATKLSVLKSLAAIIPSCPPALQKTGKYRSLMYDFAEKAIREVPVFHLECLPNPEAVSEIRKALSENSVISV